MVLLVFLEAQCRECIVRDSNGFSIWLESPRGRVHDILKVTPGEQLTVGLTLTPVTPNPITSS